MPDYPTAGMPPFINRMLSASQWQEYLASYDFGPIAPSMVVLHHTWSPTVAQWAGLRTMQNMQTYYGHLKWKAGPHLFVAPDGIWLATPMRDIGIHANSGNSWWENGRLHYSIGVETVGNYDDIRPSGVIWDYVKLVIGSLSRRLGIAPRRLVRFHREFNSTKTCPGHAVTKEWVFGEIEAWLHGQQAPPPSPPTLPEGPAPEHDQLIEVLMSQAFSRRAEGYSSAESFHAYAVQNNLGYPIAPSGELSEGGATYVYQPFARDTLYTKVPEWGQVQRLSELLGGTIPDGGLGRQLLDKTYESGGSAFHPNWAFHQQALNGQLGPPIGQSARVPVGRIVYNYQVFALDTLYTPLAPVESQTNWGDVRRLSALANTRDPGEVTVREKLLEQTYAKAGATYHPDWAFHGIARSLNLGAPLSDSYRVATETTKYAIQVYAIDVLYSVVDHWADVFRASQLISPSATLGEEPPLTALLSTDVVFDTDPAPHHILQYGSPRAQPTAYGTRSRSRIALIVLHSDPGPADLSLPQLTSISAQAMPHYYVALDGALYQLVDDAYATWHAGMAHWKGRRQNINRISLGITIERGTYGYHEQQLAALAWLVDTLRERYDLPVESVVRWGDLDPRHADDPAGFPWEAFVNRLGQSVHVHAWCAGPIPL